MRGMYGDGYGYAMVEHAHHDIYNVIELWVEEDVRGEGHGTAIMLQVIADAEAEGVQLWLTPLSVDSRDADLIRFYSKLGFEWLGVMYMIRKPSERQTNFHDRLIT